MGLWKITGKGPKRVSETSPKKEELLEANLEEWIAKDPSILGEPLLIIGRQVIIPDIKDRLDLLAVDTQGNSVIVELKRGKLKDPVDIQALRYASYISKWSFEDFEDTLRNFIKKTDDTGFNFNAIYEAFCEEVGIDEVPDINKNQRIIIVGNSVRDKLGSVALWLYEHGINVKIIEINAYKTEEGTFIEPAVVVPLPVSRFAATGSTKDGLSPWIKDGKTWHLEKRCSEKTRLMLTTIDQMIQEYFEVDGPIWQQKHYVAYRVNNYNWLIIITSQNYLRLDFLVKNKSFKAKDIAAELKVAIFDPDDSLSEKIELPSSIAIKKRNERTDRIFLRVKDDFNLGSKKFIKFLKDAYSAFPK